MIRTIAVSTALFLAVPASADSICFGDTSNGRLENACQLPRKGDAFRAYSTMLHLAGRTYVHCQVRDVLVEAYATLHKSNPDKIFVYGETGKKLGGEFEPHKTHQNGLSVDFMVPVLNKDGESVPLPTNVMNRYGYDIEFSLDGVFDHLTIDYEALADHLLALKNAAEENGVGIWRVIFDPKMQPALRETEAWPEIESLQFSTRRSWVRHDEHYHVDFVVPCEPLS